MLNTESSGEEGDHSFGVLYYSIVEKTKQQSGYYSITYNMGDDIVAILAAKS